MNEQDTIRVIIPAYNAAHFLAETVASVLAARDVNVRVVIVNDGSQDDTATVARRLQDSHANVLLIDQPNSGVSSARNAGLDATDRYVCFLDADDLLVPDGLANLLRTLRANDDAVAAYGNAGYLLPSGERMPPHPVTRQSGDIGTTVLRGNLVDTPGAVLFRAEAVQRIGGFLPGVRIGEDWNFYARIAQLGPILFFNDTVIWYRLHQGSVMSSGRRSLTDFRSALDATYGDATIRMKYSDQALRKLRLDREIGLTTYIVQRSPSFLHSAASVANLIKSTEFVRCGGYKSSKFWRLIAAAAKHLLLSRKT